MTWDRVVDMVCTGAGPGGLAAAVAVHALGGEAFVADLADTRARSDGQRRPWLSLDIADAETCEYFAALSCGLEPLPYAGDSDVPITLVHEPPVERGGSVAPFVGARLREWAARCLASSYGYLYSRVSDWPTTTRHTADGELIEVADIGAISPDPLDVGGSVRAWLTAQAREHDVDIEPNCALLRIVFDDGRAVGAVFATPDGPLAVRARHGVTVVPPAPVVTSTMSDPSVPDSVLGDTPLRVCLVGRYASRFGRVELLAAGPSAGLTPSACQSTQRALRVNLHETRGQSPTWRCGKQ